jgi:hemerythrin superfamily protein
MRQHPPSDQYWGRGPKGYARSDDRIFEDVCEALGGDGELDARYVWVSARGGRVLLEGRVATRDDKYLAEELAAKVPGVQEVENRVRVGARRQADAFAEIRERGVLGQLVHEHRRIAAMFDIVLGTPANEPDDRLAKFAILARELLAHAHAEDEVVYEQLAGSAAVGSWIDRSRDEHQRIEALIREIEQLGDANEHWMNRVKALELAVEHHVDVEEHLVIPRARVALDDGRVDRLLRPYTAARAREEAAIELDVRATARASRDASGKAAPDPSEQKPETHRSDAHGRAARR